jgi:hypothetical protein
MQLCGAALPQWPGACDWWQSLFQEGTVHPCKVEMSPSATSIVPTDGNNTVVVAATKAEQDVPHAVRVAVIVLPCRHPRAMQPHDELELQCESTT